MNENPEQGNPGPKRKKHYPVPSPGIRLQLKGEIWLDSQAVTEILGISKRSLLRYRRLKGLACSHIGNRFLYSETALLQFINDHIEPKSGRET
jgi:hypothetical protein